MLERKTLSVGGILLSYLFAPGIASKPPLLFLHGWRSEANVWQSAMESFAEEGYAVCALDLPGFGSSGNPPSAFSVAQYAEVVRGFMQKAEIPEAILIGHSFGGRIAIALAVRYPDSAEKLVLVDSAGVREASLKTRSAGIIAKIFKPVFSLPFMQPVRRALYKAWGAEDYLATPALRETFKLVVAEDLSPLFPGIRQESLLIWGEHDLDTPVSAARLMERSIPNARLEILRDAGHFSFLDAPEAFVSLVRAFAGSRISSRIQV